MTLRRVQAVTDGEVGLAHLLQGQLDVAQLGGLLFEIVLRLFDFAEIALLLVLGLVLAQQPEQLLLFFLIGLQRMEFGGDGGLAFSFSRLVFSSRRMSSTRSRF